MTRLEEVIQYLDVEVRDFLDGKDWLGTGSDMSWANEKERKAKEELERILILANSLLEDGNRFDEVGKL